MRVFLYAVHSYDLYHIHFIHIIYIYRKSVSETAGISIQAFFSFFFFLPLPRLPLFQKLSYVEHKELKNKHALSKKEAKGQTVNCPFLFNLKGTPCFTPLLFCCR